MKTYRSTNQIVNDVERLLAANRPSFHHSPLEEVAGLLIEGRHYSWAGIFLTFDKNSLSAVEQSGAHPAHLAVLDTVKKIVVSIKIAGRELGFLNAESDRENAFGVEDRVLLERVAGLLARFLTGSGKYLVRKAAQIKSESPSKAAAA